MTSAQSVQKPPFDVISWAAVTSAASVALGLALALRRSVRREKALLARIDSLCEMAMTDPLTGLSNRRYLYERSRQSLALARRQDLPVGLLLVDLDDFKSVNDRYGHAAGDSVLEAVARELESDKRAEDLVVRYGGEEFVLLLEGTDTAGALARADRLRRGLHRLGLPIKNGGEVRVSASFGVASYPETSGPSIEGLILDADKALYHAKTAGRDRCVAAPPRLTVPARYDGRLEDEWEVGAKDVPSSGETVIKPSAEGFTRRDPEKSPG